MPRPSTRDCRVVALLAAVLLLAACGSSNGADWPVSPEGTYPGAYPAAGVLLIPGF